MYRVDDKPSFMPLKEIIRNLEDLDCKSFRNDLRNNGYEPYLINHALYYLKQEYEREQEREWEIARAYGLK